MDVFMPDGEGTQVAGMLQSRTPNVKAILISANAGAVYEQLAQSNGAEGFISRGKKRSTHNQLFNASDARRFPGTIQHLLPVVG